MSKTLCNLMLRALGFVNMKILMPLAQKLGAQVGVGVSAYPENITGVYVEPHSQINMFLYEAASMEPPDQAKLNACMELMRGKNTENLMVFLGNLAVSYGPQEAFVRVATNLLSDWNEHAEASGQPHELKPMNPITPQSTTNLLTNLSQVDYNPANYLPGTAPIAPIPQIVLLGLVALGLWMVFGRHGAGRVF